MRAGALRTLPSSADDTLFHRLPTPTVVVGETGEVVSANDAALELFSHLDPIGLRLTTVFGLTGATWEQGFVEQIELGRRAHGRITVSDSQVLDAQSTPLAEGGSVVSFFDVSAYVRNAELGSRDALTGLPNRLRFAQALEDALTTAARTDTPISVLWVDLDRFKSVNDTLGHPIGDALLVKVAERLRSATRKQEVVARMGGDEFAIIQTGGEQPFAAEALAARIVDLVGRTYVVSGHTLNIGASVGIAMWPADGSDAETLIKRADLALYRAKSAGRGRFSFFEPDMDERMQRRRAMELDLRRALALREFELAFQPQFRAETGALVGFEALLRWRSNARGPVSPAEFIPLAEEIGLMVPIGEWVLRTACRTAAAWPEPISVAVNLSAVQFQGCNLVQTVASALASAGLAPSRLELEITESVLLEDTDAVLTALNGLRALGVRISMDDFGTGYSSLSYLQKFPFNKIKIDQSFVRSMGDDADSKAIVRAVAALGASLGMTTTAEGVETPEQLEAIRAEGCTDVQGFLTGRPMDAEHAAALTATHATPK